MLNNKNLSWEDAVIWLKNQPDKQQLVFDCYFDDPIADAAERYYNSSEWKAIRKIIKKYSPYKVLDIGAGRGITSYALAKEGCKVTALEPDESSIVGIGAINNLCTNTKVNIEIIQGFGESTIFADESFDMVFVRQCLHHAADLQQFCNEIHRILKKNGLFIAVREHVISTKNDLIKFQNNHPLHFLYKGENAYLLKEYLNYFHNSKFKIKGVLDNLSSEINLYPATYNDIRKKLKMNLPSKILYFLLKFYSKFDKTPGRLYSFIAEKT